MKQLEKMSYRNKRNVIIIGSVFLVALTIVLIQGILSYTGRYQSIDFSVPENGGTYTITNRRNLIYGFKIAIPQDAYTSDMGVVISTEKPDELLSAYPRELISPLININININQNYSEVPLTITIPINIDSETEFAMAFYVDSYTGFLEAIPVHSLTDTELVIKVRHVGSIIVSKTTYDHLDSSSLNATGYHPGEDDWPYANYGSILAPEGHCAGQTLTSAYYYINQAKLGEESLWTRFDNDTNDFWFDDSDAYRYSSIIQDSIDFTSTPFLDSINPSIDSQRITYYSFKYAIEMTDNPQFLALYSIDGTTIESGHAMLVYKVDGNTLYVADPNRPGNTTRQIQFHPDNGFSTYMSGDNANDLSIEYNSFVYSGLSAFVDFRLLEQEYQRMLDGTIGAYRMPTFVLDYMETYSVNSADIVWENVETPFTVSPDYNQTVPTNLEDKLIISGTTGVQEAVYTIYQDGEVVYGGITPSQLEGYFVYELPLEQGTHTYGVLASLDVDGTLYYIDFVEFTYTYQGN